MSWTDAQIDAYFDDCFSKLESAQAALERRFNIGHYPRWNIDQTRGELIFSDEIATRLTCAVFALGTHGGEQWKWAWANPSILDAFSCKSRELQSLATETGLEIFQMNGFAAEEHMPWQLCGIALDRLGGMGVYRCPSSSADLYVIISDIVRHA